MPSILFVFTVNLLIHWFSRADHSGLRPLKHWGRGFKSHSRHGCLYAFILCLCCSVQVAALRLADPPPKVSYRLSVWLKNSKQRPMFIMTCIALQNIILLIFQVSGRTASLRTTRQKKLKPGERQYCDQNSKPLSQCSRGTETRCQCDGQQYLCISSFCNFLRSTLTFKLLDSSILCNTLYSDTLNSDSCHTDKPGFTPG
jgi:hypothetical protein